MVPDFIPYDNGVEEENNDDDIPDNAAVTPDEGNDEHRPVVTNHGLYHDLGEGENRTDERRGDVKQEDGVIEFLTILTPVLIWI